MKVATPVIGCQRLSSPHTMSNRPAMHHRHAFLSIALLLHAMTACVGSSASSSSRPPPVPEPAPVPRIIDLEDGSYVELAPGLEPGFAHCCGDEQYQLNIECSEGLIRCYERKGKRWKQTYGRHCKSALDQQCYERTCARVCDAYRAIGSTRWSEVIGN